MEAVKNARKIIVIASIVLALVLLVSGLAPALPSTKPVSPDYAEMPVRIYLRQNLFSIIFFIAAVVAGVIVEIYGISVRRNIKGLQSESMASVTLGIFIFVSSVWILTDSSALVVFTTDYGGLLDLNTIVFVSFLCIMLLPMIFIDFLQYIIPIAKTIWILDSLFALNMFAFVLLSFFHLNKNVYFSFLILHHVMIYILMLYGAVYCIKDLRKKKNAQSQLFSRGVLLFMIFSFVALVVFLMGRHKLYAVLYGLGFAIMVQYMVRLTVRRMMANYNEAIKMELYKSIAYTDVLTDLRNRNALIKEQYGSEVDADTCCVVMDVDQLKWVNDTLGHHFGDQLISRSAKVISESFSALGVCYRTGGDEFAVVCKDVDEAAVKAQIEEMNSRIAAANDESALRISLSCGYAFGGGAVHSFEALLDAADQNMYLDKKGRNHFSREKQSV